MATDWGRTGLAYQILTQARRDKQKKQQEIQDLFQQELMKAQIKSMFEPEDPLKQAQAEFLRQMMERQQVGAGQPITQPMGDEIVPVDTAGGGFRPEGATIGGFQFKRQPTEMEQEKALQRKARETAVVASQRERQVNLGKVRRLKSMSDAIEKEWIKTKPRKGIIGRFTGLTSILRSTLQATEQQQIDSAYRTFVKGMRAQLARAMGDVGNLSEPEQRAAQELVPNLGDSIETGKRKIQIIRDFVAELERGNIDTARDMLGITTQQGLTTFDDFSNLSDSELQAIVAGGE